MHPLSICVAPARVVAVAVPPPVIAALLHADAPTAGVAPVLLLFDFGEDMSAARQCADADRTETPPVGSPLTKSVRLALGNALTLIVRRRRQFAPPLPTLLHLCQGSHFADFYYSSGFDKGLGSITDPPSFLIQLSQCGQCVSFRFHACFFSFVFPFFNLHPRRECG